MAATFAPVVSAIRSRSVMAGTTAYRSALAPTQSNTRSTIAPSREVGGPGPDRGEELVDVLVRLRAAVEALPVRPDQPDQLVAHVDRDQEALAVADEDRLHL